MKIVILKFFIIFMFISAFFSCQKVIDVDLNSADPKLVIEGIITETSGPHYVKLSQTGSYFDVNSFKAISGASVIVSDNIGNIDTLQESGTNGLYAFRTLSGTAGRTYTLQVNINNEKYYAASTMPEKVEIDSVTSFKPEGLNFGPDRRAGGQTVRLYFKDPAGKGNYYRFKMYVNDTLADFNGNYLLYQDNFLDGNVVDAQFFGRNVYKDDSVRVELLSIDKATFDYFNGLNQLAPRGGGSSAAPANPPSNVSEGAVGYFSAQAISRKSIKIK